LELFNIDLLLYVVMEAEAMPQAEEPALNMAAFVNGCIIRWRSLTPFVAFPDNNSGSMKPAAGFCFY
jgi:hypothetical protein